jgi:TolB-like protein
MKVLTILNLRLPALFLFAVMVAGCASSGPYDDANTYRQQDKDLVGASYNTADAMLSQVPWLRENRQPLLTGTFVNVNSLEDSSALGRIVAEQISSRFAQQGFTMVELKLRRNVFIKTQGGEFMLSREVKNLSRLHNAAAVIAGTYAIGRRNVYVSARLIRAADNLIIASHDYALPMGPDTKALLAGQ